MRWAWRELPRSAISPATSSPDRVIQTFPNL